jgi:hypothetical protein
MKSFARAPSGNHSERKTYGASRWHKRKDRYDGGDLEQRHGGRGGRDREHDDTERGASLRICDFLGPGQLLDRPVKLLPTR